MRMLWLASCLALAACGSGKESNEMSADGQAELAGNPLLQASELSLQAPPFDRIATGHFRPAFEVGMREHLADIEAIANNPQAPDFTNTLEAMERSGATLERTRKIFFQLTELVSDDALLSVQTEVAPLLAAHNDAIYQNQALYARVDRLFQEREGLALDPESLQLLELTHRRFLRAGAHLSADKQARLRAINSELAGLEVRFQENLQKETEASAVYVDAAEALAGLDESSLAAAAEAARSAGHTNGFLLTLESPSSQSILAQLDNSGVRAVVFEAATNRGSNGNAYDNQATVSRLAQLRAEKAGVLGYASYAAYVLEEETAGTPEAVMSLLHQLAPKIRLRAEVDAAAMQAWMNEQGIEEALEPWDWSYRARQLRQAQSTVNEGELRTYFELNRVLADGVFGMARELYGIEFSPRDDLPVWHPDVRVYEVREDDGRVLGLYYLDPFARPGKSGGAWMDSFVDQTALLEQRAVVLNALNIARPGDGQPVLLSFDEVTTLFHEFGHAVHGLFSEVRYPSLSGTNVPRDFVEFPSQFHEDFALVPRLLDRYARHFQTGEPLPGPLLDALHESRRNGQGFDAFEYIAAALLDQRWHGLPAGSGPINDVVGFEFQALRADGVAWVLIPPRYRSTYFSHIWPGGYAAGYYAYLWSEVLAADAYDYLGGHGGMTRENGQRFRDRVLSRGHTGDPMLQFRAFRGREPVIEPMLRRRGIDEN
ncbi:MAG: M3 family metallopeptidase [Xanthomonadales bacterium]|nr:M3 family metallopeptidase [Xanthomonadales bacterium]